VGARLLVVRSEVADPTVEIVHESLITQWPRLAHWLAEAEDDLVFLDQIRTTARQWEDRGRPDGLLWRGSALDEARLWHARNQGRELSRREQAYLDAVFELEDRARQRRRNVVLGALTIMALIATAAVSALVWIGRAERNARVAAEQARDQAERTLAAQEQAKRESRRAAAADARAEVERGERERAENSARSASATVEETKEDLRKANTQLAKSLEEQRRQTAGARKAKEQAQKEAERAQAAEASLKKRRAELERLLSEKEKRVRELEAQKSKISVELK
jgi:hypothetical protein